MERRTLPGRVGCGEPSDLHSQVSWRHRARTQDGLLPGTCGHNTFSPSPRTALELGSGAGLTGLAICKTCRPRAYVFSDCHSRVLEQLRGNVLLNGFSLDPSIDAWAQHPGPHTPEAERPRVAVAQLDWDTVTAPQLAAFQPDVVLAAGTAQLSAGTQQWTLPGGRNGGTWVAWASGVMAQRRACLLGTPRPQLPCPRPRPRVFPREWSLLWRSQLCPARHAMNRTGPRHQTSGTSLSQAIAQRPDFTSLSSSLREASHPEQR